MRVLLDTNAVSELRRAAPDPRVVRCVRAVAAEDSFLSVLTIGELVFGVKRLPQGRKRLELEAWLSAIEREYSTRILAVDFETAQIWGEIAAIREAMGRPLSVQDGLIAATAIRNGLHLVTRNVSDFEHTGVLAVDPWSA